jgi:hypothetical protein
VLLHRLSLVEALQGAVVPLVEAPGALDRNPHAIHGIEHDPQRSDRALQHGSEGDVDAELFLQQLAPGLRRFQPAWVRQIDVGPTSEQVLDIPDALAVANENQFSGHVNSSSHGAGVRPVALGRGQAADAAGAAI